MWLYLAALLGLYFLCRWYRERQIVENLREKYVLITGCDSGFGNLLAKQLDVRGLRVLAACLTQRGAEQLRKATSERLQTVILDVTRTDSIAAATAWVKEQVGDKEILTTKPSTNLYLVTDCIEHALTSCHPRTRYSGGWDAQFFYIPLSYLPTALADGVLTWSWPRPAQAV
uniref:17-beta-hydroxysteroid dehydrogenase type 6 n=1 Tax=Chelonoidis abingdonii TaxID=106734 RepID=A0A8C0GG44_CHEAB